MRGVYPRPWRIEEDWTYEIIAADGDIVLKLPYPSHEYRDLAERLVVGCLPRWPPMIADDFKAIRERRDQLGGQDIIKEYATPTSVRELTPVEKMRREAEALADWFGLRS